MHLRLLLIFHEIKFVRMIENSESIRIRFKVDIIHLYCVEVRIIYILHHKNLLQADSDLHSTY